MNTTRLVKGEIFFDEFNSPDLDSKWTLVPYDPLRFSLIERPGYLKVFHGDPDIMFLIDEPSDYILDMKNDYVPFNGLLQAGLVVFKEVDNNLEILEYFDEERDVTSIYEYIRLIKSGDIYTVYGRQTSNDSWELIASLEFQSAGKVGLICKGPSVAGSSPFSVDYIRIYKSKEVQIINVPVGYRVDLYREETDSVIYSRRVLNPFNGAILLLDEIPNVRAYFKIVDDIGDVIHRSQGFDMCGGDIYFYGSTLKVFVNGLDMKFDEEYFLGYYQSNKIDFTVTIQNVHEVAFEDVVIEAIPYLTDVIGCTLVEFCETIDGTYSHVLTVGTIPGLSSTTIYGRITRSDLVEPSDIDPFKFNLKITNS